MSLGLLAFTLVTSLGNYSLPFLYKITINSPTGKILSYIDQLIKTDLVYSVQIRCLLGADSVLLVEPESYLYSIRSSTISGTTRCKHGAVLVKLGARVEPESYFHPIRVSTVSGGALGAKNLMHPGIISGPFWDDS